MALTARVVVDAMRLEDVPAVHEIERDMTKVTFDVISATLLPSADATIGLTLSGTHRT